METAIKKADEKISYLASDDDAMRVYEMREKAMFDYTSGMSNAKLEGKLEGKIELAENALHEGISIGVIAKITGLDESTINHLKAELERG